MTKKHLVRAAFQRWQAGTAYLDIFADDMRLDDRGKIFGVAGMMRDVFQHKSA